MIPRGIWTRRGAVFRIVCDRTRTATAIRATFDARTKSHRDLNLKNPTRARAGTKNTTANASKSEGTKILKLGSNIGFSEISFSDNENSCEIIF